MRLWGEDFVPALLVAIAVALFLFGAVVGWLAHRLAVYLCQPPAPPLPADWRISAAQRHIGRGSLPLTFGRHALEGMRTRDLSERVDRLRVRPPIPPARSERDEDGGPAATTGG